jgi:hypothetical protein
MLDFDMPNKEEEITKLILEYARTRGRATGSELGSEVRDKLGTVDFRTQYGGLRAFIEGNTSGRIRWMAKKGSDDVYAYDASDATAPPTPSHAGYGLRQQEDAVSLWSMLTNPKHRSFVLVNAESGSLTPRNENDPTALGDILIEGLTVDDYRQIATNFLTQIPRDTRTEFERVIDVPTFWTAWSALLYRHRSEGLYPSWGKFRIEEAKSRIEKKMLDAGVDQSKVPLLLQVLERSRQSERNRKETDPKRQDRILTASEVRPAWSTTSDPHSVAHAIIDKLSVEQLRQIWVPLGSVIDLLETDESKRHR